YISVSDLHRERFARHPWSLQGGGAMELKGHVERRAASRLESQIWIIGRTAHTSADEVYFARPGDWRRRHIEQVVELVEGDVVRDWRLHPATSALFPYDGQLEAHVEPAAESALWPHRQFLIRRREPNGTHLEIGLEWFEWSRFHPDRFKAPLSIAFAFVATHNHFVLDRGGKVFNRSAPVIKLPAGASEDDHLALLGLLNSSTACFWMKQVCHNKGGPGGAHSKDEKWNDFYEHDGSKLQQLPLPSGRPLELANRLDALARENSALVPSALAAREAPGKEAFREARDRHAAVASRMIALQEELDWHCYGLYGLLDDDLCAPPDAVPGIEPGERAFEIVLARQMAAGEVATQWFARHGLTPITEIPAHWPATYRELVERRIEAIQRVPEIALIERPEYKRRWNTESWEVQEQRALRGWLL